MERNDVDRTEGRSERHPLRELTTAAALVVGVAGMVAGAVGTSTASVIGALARDSVVPTVNAARFGPIDRSKVVVTVRSSMPRSAVLDLLSPAPASSLAHPSRPYAASTITLQLASATRLIVVPTSAVVAVTAAAPPVGSPPALTAPAVTAPAVTPPATTRPAAFVAVPVVPAVSKRAPSPDYARAKKAAKASKAAAADQSGELKATLLAASEGRSGPGGGKQGLLPSVRAAEGDRGHAKDGGGRHGDVRNHGRSD